MDFSDGKEMKYNLYISLIDWTTTDCMTWRVTLILLLENVISFLTLLWMKMSLYSSSEVGS